MPKLVNLEDCVSDAELADAVTASASEELADTVIPREGALEIVLAEEVMSTELKLVLAVEVIGAE